MFANPSISVTDTEKTASKPSNWWRQQRGYLSTSIFSCSSWLLPALLSGYKATVRHLSLNRVHIFTRLTSLAQEFRFNIFLGSSHPNTRSFLLYRGLLVSALLTTSQFVWSVALGSDERFVPQHHITNFSPAIVRFHPKDHNFLMVLNNDGRIDLFDIRNWEKPIKFFELSATANYASFDKHGERLLAAGRDGKLRIWNFETGKTTIRSISESDFPVLAAAFQLQSDNILSVSAVGDIQVWDGKERKEQVNIFSGEENIVTSTAIHPDGKLVVVGDPNGTVRWWNVADAPRKINRLSLHQSAIQSIAISPNGENAVSGDANGVIWTWHLKGKQDPTLLQSHGYRVTTLAFSADGKRIVSGDREGFLRIWYTRPGILAEDPIPAHEGSVTSVAFSANGTRIASAGSPFFNDEVRLWDVGPKVLLREVEDYSLSLLDVVFDSESQQVVAADDEGTVRKWDSEVGTQTYEVRRSENTTTSNLTLSNDGSMVAFVNEDEVTEIWNIADRNRVFPPIKDDEDGIRSLAFSNDGTHIVFGSDEGSLRVCNISNTSLATMQEQFAMPSAKKEDLATQSNCVRKSGGRVRVSFVGQVNDDNPFEGHVGPVNDVALGPNNTTVISGSRDGTVRMWNSQDSTNSTQLESPYNDPVFSVAYSSDGTRVLSGRKGGTIDIWNVQTGASMRLEELAHRDAVTAVEFSPDNTRFASGGRDGKVRLWDLMTGSALAEVATNNNSEIQDLAFHSGGHQIVFRTSDDTVHVWTIANARDFETPIRGKGRISPQVSLSSDGMQLAIAGFESIQVRDFESVPRIPVSTDEYGDTVVSVAFSPDGSRVVGGYSDGRLQMWDAKEGKVVADVQDAHRNTVDMVTFSRDGKVVISKSSFVDPTIRVWDASTLSPKTKPLPINDFVFLGPAISPNGNWVVFSDDDEMLSLWDVQSDKVTKNTKYILDFGFEIEGVPVFDGGLASSFAFLPDRDVVASVSGAGIVRFWNTHDLSPYMEPIQVSSYGGAKIAFSPDSEYFVSGSIGGLVELWRLGKGKVVDPVSTCSVRNIEWLAKSTIAVYCDDRILLFDDKLEHRGNLYLDDDGILAVALRHGVYAMPSILKDSVLTFRDAVNQGTTKLIDVETMRRVLFNEFDLAAYIVSRTRILGHYIREIHVALGGFAIPVWLILLWALNSITAGLLWIFLPSQLAWWSMPRAGAFRLSTESLPVWNYIAGMLLAYRFLGHTQRPLTKWLQKNSKLLHLECFGNRSAVKERDRYLAIDGDQCAKDFLVSVIEGDRGLLWIDGVGGSGKSALAMHILNYTWNSGAKSPLPVLVSEDWTGSLVAQVRQQLRHPSWDRGPTVSMTRALGALGLVCPLVDSLSERDEDAALESVKQAIACHDFRHLLVTSRNPRPEDQGFQSMRCLSPKPLTFNDTRLFIETYLLDGGGNEMGVIEDRIAPFLDRERMPNPLFLRFAIEQGAVGPLKAIDRTSLVLEYVEALRFGKLDIQSEDMKRASAIAAIESVQERFVPKEFTEVGLSGALTREGHSRKFFDASGNRDLSVPRVVEMLIGSGVIVRGTRKLQFAYDPVAEYLAAWWVSEVGVGFLDTLRERMSNAVETEVGRAYRDIMNTEGQGT